MAGVRIQHPTARSVRFTITDPDRPYPRPFQCSPPEFGGCGQVHLFKTHHLNLDDTGAVIVGDDLYRLARPMLEAAGFRETNLVPRPPTLGVGLAQPVPGRGPWGNIPIVRAEGG